MKSRVKTLFITLSASGFCFAAQAAEYRSAAEQSAFFEENIRPVMIKHCYKCHSEAEDKKKGGLTMDTRVGLRAGGSSGHAIIPGDARGSLLLTAINYGDEDLQMPPDDKLSASIIDNFEKWIQMGAPDPRVDDPRTVNVNWRDPKYARDFWAFKKPLKPATPSIKNESWPKSDIDHFVLAQAEGQGLRMVDDADRPTLARRAYYDLLGLPPSPDTVGNFTRSTDPTAWERLIDMLLESDSFGEKWGRHWLDVARYAESSGKESNVTFPHAWRYRDYVIKAFNDDKPYDRFIQEQIAGDLLSGSTPEKKAELMVATGFLALGPKSLNEANRNQFRADLIDEQIDTMSKAILGVTIACARCHDHKFDPISQREYYALAGIFLSTDTYFGTVATQGNRQSSRLLQLPIKDTELSGRKMSVSELSRLQQAIETQKEERSKIFQQARAARNGGEGDPALFQQQLRRLNTRINVSENLIKTRDAEGRPLSLAMGVRDSRRVQNARLLERGELDSPKELIQRGFLNVLGDERPVRLSYSSSGRKELAHWLTAEDNPLFARVMVNRIWSWLMGRGIVETIDNFGVNGKRPSHPELLDHLAIRFRELGYSVKKMAKEIMMSRTYRLSSVYSARNFHRDPDNVFYWQKSKRRLTAEEVRDAILTISGELRYNAPRGSGVSYAGDGAVGRNPLLNENSILGESFGSYRSVYLPVLRDLLPEVFNVFDFAEPSLVIGQRDVTIVPGQALYFMNSPFVIEQAKITAERISELQKSSKDRINYLYMLTLGREATDQELRIAQIYVDDFVIAVRSEGNGTRTSQKLALSTFCQSLMSCAEFRYIN